MAGKAEVLGEKPASVPVCPSKTSPHSPSYILYSYLKDKLEEFGNLSKTNIFFGNRVYWIEKYFPLGQGWRTFLRVRAQIVYKFLRISFACHENFEDQNKVLQPSIIIIVIVIFIIIITIIIIIIIIVVVIIIIIIIIITI
jgi:hypothetical protein